MITKPMLAATVKDIGTLRYPLLASAKLDGIRALMVNGRLLSRAFKPIPNHYIRTTLEGILPNGVDGEIIVGKTFQETSSAVMSYNGKPDFTYYAFDLITDLTEPFSSRNTNLQNLNFLRLNIIALEQTMIKHPAELEWYESICLNKGNEGVILRSASAPYKCGRSTLKEQYLLKLKRFTDGEAVVIGVEELMHNENPKELNELGYAKRSSHQENKVSSKMLGALVVRDLENDVTFKIGTGFTEEQRKEMWDGWPIHKIVKYKFLNIGVKDKPRHPVFLGFRNERDM